MGNSAPVPPDDPTVPEGDDLDEAEMTSIMDAEQRRELQRAARVQKEPERETARPPPEAVLAVETEVVIPKAAAVPTDVAHAPARADAAARAPAAAGAASREPTPMNTWTVVAFVLLAAAIAFEMR